MGLNFEFSTSPRILFGNKSVQELPAVLPGKKNHVLLVTGSNPDRYLNVIDLIRHKTGKITIYKIIHEPGVEDIGNGKTLSIENGCDIVIGIGGGSVIDGAKAIAAVATNHGDMLEYLEVIGNGKPLLNKPLPFIAIPTTSGTGAEVTKNAVIRSPEHRIKVSLRSPLMFPETAIIDPELTCSMPPDLTASSGIDALTHLLESFVSLQSNPFIDNICREGMALIAQSLHSAFHDGDDKDAREKMCLASMMGGMALANVRLGAVHGFAGPVGGMFDAPHGTVCACLLPAVFETNLRNISDQGLKPLLVKFGQIGKILIGDNNAEAGDALLWLKRIVSELKIPGLSEYGISEHHFSEIAEKAAKSSSMKGNPLVLSHDDLISILKRSV
jgi:alcohol dehydrogenase class IV